MIGAVLTARALNRTLLERQHLLRRTTIPVTGLVRHLVAVQAQERDSPYVQLWSRIEGFAVEDLTAPLRDRTVVRGPLLRGTQHMTAAADYPWLRPLVAPVLARARQAGFGRVTQGLDLDALVVAARQALAADVLTRPQLGRLLAERFPGYEPNALGWSAQCLIPVVHPAPEGTWRRGGATPFALAGAWLGRDVEGPGDVAELIRRYLAAFGPATVADVQAWSRLTRLREVADGMDLRVHTAEGGRELLDVPDAPVLTGDEPAPVRFVADFDNLLLGHADRTRIISDEDRRAVIDGAVVLPTFLVDGFVAGTWAYRKGELTVTPFRPLAAADRAAVDAEASVLLEFLRA